MLPLEVEAEEVEEMAVPLGFNTIQIQIRNCFTRRRRHRHRTCNRSNRNSSSNSSSNRSYNKAILSYSITQASSYTNHINSSSRMRCPSPHWDCISSR